MYSERRLRLSHDDHEAEPVDVDTDGDHVRGQDDVGRFNVAAALLEDLELVAGSRTTACREVISRISLMSRSGSPRRPATTFIWSGTSSMTWM